MYVFNSLTQENNFETIQFLKKILNKNNFKMYSRLLGEEREILNKNTHKNKYKFMYIIDDENKRLEVLYFKNNSEKYFIKFDISNEYPFNEPKLYLSNNKDFLFELCKMKKDKIINKSLKKKIYLVCVNC